MITTMTFVAANGVNTVTLNDDTNYPVNKLSWEYPTDGADISKAQTYGQWPTRKFVRKMPIECEGWILSSSSSNYWSVRKALLLAIVPNPSNTSTNHGRLSITFDDNSSYFADVTLVGFQVPLEALAPTMTPFQFQWEAQLGYWTNYSTGQQEAI